MIHFNCSRSLQKRNLLLITLLFIITASSCQKSNSTIYYVSNSGDDKADGLSPASAWKTISKVNGQKFLPGDSILLEAGGIWREELVVRGSGTMDDWITYSRYGNGSNPKILASKCAKIWHDSGYINIWKSSENFTNPMAEYYGVAYSS